MSRSLLVPLDGSELAEAALPWAVLLARTHKLPVLLVRVISPMYLMPTGVDGYMSAEFYDEVRVAAQEEATTYLAAVEARLAADGVPVTTSCRLDVPSEAILDVADEHGAAAIVMATHGRGGLTRLVLGSVAERIVGQAIVPILLVRPREGQAVAAPSLGRLLVPLDGSSLAERALDLVQAIAPDPAHVMLVRVVAPVEHATGLVGASAQSLDVVATQRASAEAEEYLGSLRDRFQGARFAVQTARRSGQPADELLAAARATHADAIVLSTHGRTGARRWLMGSVADAVVRRAAVPVLLVSARALTARAAAPFSVRDLMTRDVATVRADELVAALVRKLLRRRVGGTPVLDASGKLVGVVSEHDVLAWERGLEDLLVGDPGMSLEEYQRHVASATVADVMARSPVTIDEAASLSAAIRMLVDHGLRRLPVVRDGQLVGIVTRSDVLRALASRLEAAAAPPAAPAPSAHGTLLVVARGSLKAPRRGGRL